MQKIFERVQAAELDLDPQKTGKVFNVLGDVFPANQLERMIRDMYARNQMTEELIKQRIVEQVDTKRLERITNSTLEGLAKRELNLSAIVGKSAEAKERRLVPEVIEEFFTQAAPISGVQPKETREGSHIYRLGKVPRTLWPVGERLEPRFGKLGREYQSIVFDKEQLKRDPTLEWVTPGHPLFEAVREDVTEQVRADLERLLFAFGAVLERDALTLSAHTREDALFVLLGQIQALNTDVHNLDTILLQGTPIHQLRKRLRKIIAVYAFGIGIYQGFQVVVAQRRRQS